MNTISELIKGRRSVRTFDGRQLSLEHRKLLQEHIENAENPFGVSVNMRLLDAKENNLSSPVIVGENLYLAAKVKRIPNCEIAFGYSFEETCLYAQSLGIGTVMLAATLSRTSFETAMQVGADEVLPCASPVGYPASKMSVRESLMRKGIKADQRIPFETLYFRNSFDTKLTEGEAGIFSDALNMMRLAPSAGNKQPWRAVIQGDTVHFFECHSMPENRLGDIQKVDMGIGLCHFDLTMQEKEVSGHFVTLQPAFPANDKLEYIISYEVKN